MEPETKSNGATIGLVIIALILIVGGVYIWQSKVKNTLDQKQDNTTTTQADTSTSLNTTDTTQLDSLGKELDTTDTTVGVDVNTLK